MEPVPTSFLPPMPLEAPGPRKETDSCVLQVSVNAGRSFPKDAPCRVLVEVKTGIRKLRGVRRWILSLLFFLVLTKQLVDDSSAAIYF